MAITIQPTKSTRADLCVREAVDDEVGRRLVARLFEQGLVTRSGRRLRKGDRVEEGDEIIIEMNLVNGHMFSPIPERDSLEILHEDACTLVFNKPAAMPSHPLDANEAGTLANRIVAHFPAQAKVGEDPREAGLVHRLDAGTSGVILAARTQETWLALRDAFSKGVVKKEYVAWVERAPTLGPISSPLLQQGPRSLPSEGGLRALTRVISVEALGEHYRVHCIAATGRMHQVRAHLASVGSPLLGDALYGGKELRGLEHHLLHASRVRVSIPDTVTLDVRAPLPSTSAWRSPGDSSS